MFRRPRPTGGRHPPPLAPTVSTFKPRAEWSNAGASMFLYLNLPGFYGDQIQIKKDEKTRTIQIQGQRPLSTHTRTRFNEYYRVPESCDMTKMKTSFLHGLLTIEMPIIGVTGKQDRAGTSMHVDGSVGLKQLPRDDEKLTQKAKEEEGRISGTGGSLERKKHEERIEQMPRREAKEEEIGRTRVPDGSLGHKKQEKEGKAASNVAWQEKENVSKHRGVSESTTKEREYAVDGLGSMQQNKEEKLGEEKASEGHIQGMAEQKKPWEGDLGKDVGEIERKEIVIVKAGLEKEEVKDEGLKKPDSKDQIMKEKTDAETAERDVESENVRDAASKVVKDQEEINGDRILSSYLDDLRKKLMLQRTEDEEQLLQKDGKPLVNAVVAALVIVGFVAYVSLPFLKLFY